MRVCMKYGRMDLHQISVRARLTMYGIGLSYDDDDDVIEPYRAYFIADLVRLVCFEHTHTLTHVR